jgi:hypothetical protein
MKLALDVASVVFAVAAALLWFLSAVVKVPKNYPMAMHLIFVRDLGAALSKQSRLSAFAAR